MIDDKRVEKTQLTLLCTKPCPWTAPASKTQKSSCMRDGQIKEFPTEQKTDRYVEEIEASAQDTYRALAERLARENVSKSAAIGYSVHWIFKKSPEKKIYTPRSKKSEPFSRDAMQ